MLGLEPDFYQKHDVHLHVPEGATPKDGPSAGIGMCTALVSALTEDSGALGRRDDRRDHAARRSAADRRPEGETAGGASRRHPTVLIPEENTKDLAEIPQNIKGNLEIKPVKWIDEVLQVALRHMPAPMAGGFRRVARQRQAARTRRVAKRASKQVRAH